MREHGAPAEDQGVGEGVAQKGWGLAGFGVTRSLGKVAVSSLQRRPTSSHRQLCDIADPRH